MGLALFSAGGGVLLWFRRAAFPKSGQPVTFRRFLSGSLQNCPEILRYKVS
ncbi:hypothetical protein D3Z48_19225 [Clostridiaceae bacterium]|nr:hypothetical protein [Clostridiaceae bacterium]